MGLSANDIEKIRETIISVFKEEILRDLERNIDIRVQQSVKEEAAEINNAIKELEDDFGDLKAKNRFLEAMLDRHEQSSRSLNVRIFGVQQREEEDLQRVVIEMFNRVKCGVKPGDIKKLYRITAKRGVAEGPRITRSNSNNNSGGGTAGVTSDVTENRPPAILICFDNDKTRQAVLQKRKQLLEEMSVRVREDLTKFRLSLLSKAIEKFTSKCAWCLHGNVYVKSGDTVHRIADYDSLEKIPVRSIPIRRRK